MFTEGKGNEQYIYLLVENTKKDVLVAISPRFQY